MVPSVRLVNRNGKEISKDLRERVERKIASVTKLDPTIQSVEVVLSVSENPSRGGDSHRVDVNAAGTGESYNATARAATFEASVADVTEKLRRQLRRAKEVRTVSKSGHRTPKTVRS